jgi:hypothetical protein
MYSHFSTQTFLFPSSSRRHSPADTDAADAVVADPDAGPGTISFKCFFIHPKHVRVNSSVYISSADIAAVVIAETELLAVLRVVDPGVKVFVFGLAAEPEPGPDPSTGTDLELGVADGPPGRFRNDCYA